MSKLQHAYDACELVHLPCGGRAPYRGPTRTMARRIQEEWDSTEKGRETLLQILRP